jgi:hypothetical protein
MPFVPYIHPQRVHEQHRVKRLKRTAPPFRCKPLHFLCCTAYEFRRYVHIVLYFLQVFLYRLRRQAQRVHRKYFVVWTSSSSSNTSFVIAILTLLGSISPLHISCYEFKLTSVSVSVHYYNT